MVEMDRRTFGKSFLTLGLGAAMLSAAGCSSSSSKGSTSKAATGGTLTIGLATTPSSLDPALQQSGSDVVQLWQAVYDTLLRYEPDGTIVPNAAKSYDVNADSTVVTLKLRDGMTFTDGSPVDAAAVKASLEYIKGGGGSDASRLANVTVTTPDTSTVVLTAATPTGLLPTFLCLAPGILSSTASHTAANKATVPVGSGPYMLDQAHTTAGATWTMVRNEKYWNKAAYPYDTVVFKLLTDITARVNALSSGQIDAAPVTSQTEAQVSGTGTIISNSVNWAGLFLADRGGKVVPQLGDVRVRQAINMVFDRPAILKALFQGHGKVTNQIFNDKSTAYLPGEVDHYPYDLDKAKALMSQAGATAGFSVEIPVITGLDYANPIIAQQLGKLGITVKQVTLPPNQIIPQLLGGRFPVFFFTLESRTALWDIVQSLQPTSIWNVTKYDDPKLDPLLAMAQTATGADAKANAQAINKYVIEQAWFCPWALPTNFYAVDKKTTAKAVLGSVAPYLRTFAPA